MAPYSKDGKKFRFKTQLDHSFWQFLSAIDLFDIALERRKEADKFCQSEVFQQIYKELGYPQIYRFYRPENRRKGWKAKLIDPNETAQMYSLLEEARKSGDKKTWKKLREEFFLNVIAERCSYARFVFETIHRQPIWQSAMIAQKSLDQKEREKALFELVEFDACFLAVPHAGDIIELAELMGHLDFRSALSRALNPGRKTLAFESQRQRYALTILSGIKYKKIPYEVRSYSDWVKFFCYFNSQLGDLPRKPRERGFWTYEHQETLTKAIKEYKIPKQPAEPGRKKKS